MSDEIHLGFVSAGKRARTLMGHAYDISERDYLKSDRADGYPASIYRMFGEDEPEWIGDVSDLSVSVTAVMSPSEGSRETARELCQDHGDTPGMYTEFDEFLDEERFDAALVCSPQDVHADAVVPLLERDVDVFCEKPLAHTLEDHDRIIEAAESSSGILYVGLQRRVSPHSLRIKELLEEGAIGRLGMISHTEVRDPFHIAHPGEKGYRYSQERSGGSLLEKNVHDFDEFNWHTGLDPRMVTAVGGQHVLTQNTDIVDHAIVTVKYEKDIVVSLELCLYNGPGERDIYDVRVRTDSEYRGSKGLLTVPSEPGVIEIDTRDERRRIDVGTRAAGGHAGDLHEVHHVLRCLRGETTPPATAVDAKKAAAVALAGERSIRNDGEPIGISDEYDLIT